MGRFGELSRPERETGASGRTESKADTGGVFHQASAPNSPAFSLLAARSEAQEWLEFFRESANPRTAEERWEYLDVAAVHIERLLAATEFAE